MSENNPDWKKVAPPLRKVIVCTGSDCKSNLHCFRTNMRKKSARILNKTYRNGTCRDCNQDLIDWSRIDRKTVADMDYTVQSLKQEFIRQEFWTREIDGLAFKNALEKGLQGLRGDAENILRKAIGMPSDKIFRDGTQTPKSKNIVYYAQHATATCCRKCVEEWYAIDRKRPLTEEEIKYFVELILRYVTERIPQIAVGEGNLKSVEAE